MTETGKIDRDRKKEKRETDRQRQKTDRGRHTLRQTEWQRQNTDRETDRKTDRRTEWQRQIGFVVMWTATVIFLSSFFQDKWSVISDTIHRNPVTQRSCIISPALSHRNRSLGDSFTNRPCCPPFVNLRFIGLQHLAQSGERNVTKQSYKLWRTMCRHHTHVTASFSTWTKSLYAWLQ